MFANLIIFFLILSSPYIYLLIKALLFGKKLYFCTKELAMKHISWGFIGLGEATEHKSGAAFNAVTESNVEAIFSENAADARTYANQLGVPHWYTDAQSMID